MKYAQLKQDGSFDYEIQTRDNIYWDETHYCPASALTVEEAALFRVVPLIETDPPSFNKNTQRCDRDGAEVVGGVWKYKWKVTNLSAEEVAANLATAKSVKNAQINDWRLKANMSTFTHAGKVIACDTLSRSDIDAVANSIALTGAFPAGFPGAWKAVDNTYIPLADVNAFKNMHASMTLQGTINFGRAQTLKTNLAAATTVEQVEAITW